ncbi:MAG: transcription elongation factor GreA [Candidatus Omnitrophica bacterium]|nr:transcription elongation factor GreA [Candidatus Omnitrophota bacterium]
MTKVHLTQEAYDKLMKEIEYLKTVRSRELSKAIGKARDQGDISENAEYDAAKEAQGLNEKRIVELEEKLASAQILDDSNIDKDKAFIGATVTLEDLDTERELKYTLVAELEADFAQKKISVTSPVGKALLGHKVGDVIAIKVPAGDLNYKVLKITR